MAMVMNGQGQNGKNQHLIDGGKYVRYTPEQVEALERVYSECPKPSSMRRQQLIRECPILSNIEPKQIKVWFQNRRCREKQRKEASRLQTVNRKLTAMNKLLMEENDRLQKQVSHLVYENGCMRSQVNTSNVATTDTSCESVVTSGQHHQQPNPTPQHPQRDANNPAGLLAIAEETLAEFLSKATGTAVEWVQMVGMKPGPDSVGIIAVSHNCSGVAARACGLVSLEPSKVAEILKDRPSWYRDCRSLDVLTVIPTGNGGIIELIYMQTYAPTTLASARDFWTLRFTSGLEDGSLVICERSLTPSTGGPAGPPAPSFVRAEMLPSGYLIRPCEGGGSMIHIVDHVDLDAWSVPEVLRPLYESPKILAQKTTIAALRHIRQIAQETSGEIAYGGGRQPAVLRTFSQRLSKGFNDAVNGFTDDGWSLLAGDGIDDVTIMINSSPTKLIGSHGNLGIFSPIGGGVLCAKASMLLQNVPPALLVRFLREHRSEWGDSGVDVYSAASLRASPYAVPGLRASSGFMGGQVILPLAHTVEHEEFLEVIRLEGHGFNHDDVVLSRDMFLLQLCSGVDENSVGSCAQLVFAPIDESFADDAPLLPSGFRVIPLDPKLDPPAATRTLDLASTLEVGPGASARAASDSASNAYNLRSVLTIAFQFSFENHLRENVAAMARQYVRSVVASVQRVAMAIAPSQLGSQLGVKHPLGSPEAQTLARWISRSYRFHTGVELFRAESEGGDFLLKLLWQHSDAIMCCSLKSSPVFTFANQAGLDMLETTLVALQDITLEKIFDDGGRKVLLAEFPKIMQQGFSYLPGGIGMSSMGRPVSYEQAVAWKVLNDEDSHHCLAFIRAFYDEDISRSEWRCYALGEEFKGYVFKIMGGCDKQGFPMKQGVLTPGRVRLLLHRGTPCFRGHGRRNGERRRKSVRGCIVSPDLSVLNLVIVKKGDSDLPGLTDIEKPRMRGPKRASKIRKLFNLSKEDDVRKYVNTYRRTFTNKKGKKVSKAPKIQRLVTPLTLQRKRGRIAEKKRRIAKAKSEAVEYQKLLATRIKEQRDRRSESLAKKRSRLSAAAAKTASTST